MTALLALVILEMFWRYNGHTPTIVDSPSLWSTERAKIGKGTKEIAFIGGSRLQADVNVETLGSLLPEYSISFLPINGTCPNEVLFDLSRDSKFTGTVVCDITEDCILRGEEELSQLSYVKYYNDVYNFNSFLNRAIENFFQERTVLLDPHVSIAKVLGELRLKKRIRQPRYWTILKNRNLLYDFTKINIMDYRQHKLQKSDSLYRSIAHRLSPETFSKSVYKLSRATSLIEKRGGKVIFVRLPVSEEHWELDEAMFPPTVYWEFFVKTVNAPIIHYRNTKNLKQFKCPDSSHLDKRSTIVFTQVFIQLLRDRHIL